MMVGLTQSSTEIKLKTVLIVKVTKVSDNRAKLVQGTLADSTIEIAPMEPVLFKTSGIDELTAPRIGTFLGWHDNNTVNIKSPRGKELKVKAEYVIPSKWG